MIVDKSGRRFRKLRVSLTSACNYACQYCVPNGRRLSSAQSELNASEFIKAVSLLQAAAGIRAIRITGGEPLISPVFDDFVKQLKPLGFDTVAITTNGELISQKLPVIQQAGIQNITVSLDSLDPLQHEQISRGGNLKKVLEGIDCLIGNGFKLKINAVPIRHQNDDQILPLIDFAFEKGIELRFIELMRMGHLANDRNFDRMILPMAEILDRIGQKYAYERIDAPFDSTATRFEVPGGGVFGIIPNFSQPFCDRCTRLRLTSTGDIYGCLSNSQHYSMRPLLDLPAYQALPQLQLDLMKALHDKQSAYFTGEETVMKIIGG